MTKKRFTVGDIQRMIANPVYAGLGPYPAIVPESQWLEVAQKASGEVGVRAYLYTLREELAKALEFTEVSLPDWMTSKDWLDVAERHYEQQPQTFFKDLLKRLRADLGGEPLG